VPTWAIIGAALVGYIVLMLALARLLRRRRREIDRLWADLYAWEEAQREATRRDEKER
jgi:hypothetical protein